MHFPLPQDLSFNAERQGYSHQECSTFRNPKSIPKIMILRISMLNENEDTVFEDISVPRIMFWGEVCYQQRRSYCRYLFMSNLPECRGPLIPLRETSCFPPHNCKCGIYSFLGCFLCSIEKGCHRIDIKKYSSPSCFLNYATSLRILIHPKSENGVPLWGSA